MFSLKDYLVPSRQGLRSFLDQIIEEKGKSLFQDTLFLSFLGARICYASTRPLCLFREKRFQDQEELLAFLMRLKASGHTSIFAHSPLVVEAGPEALKWAPFLYKAWWSPSRDKLCLNLRHFAEIYEEDVFQELLAFSLQESGLYHDFVCFRLLFEQGRPVIADRRPLSEWMEALEEPSALWAHPEVFVIDVAPERMAPFGWLAVIVEGMSRLFSHQFVRHTWLNFNQRSHRYTQVDQFVCPPSFSPEARRLYQDEVERGLSAYRRLLEWGVRKEDARFVTPQGSATTVLATAPYFVWEDFVQKRRHPKAQWEIRWLAQAIELVLGELHV